jgi:putative oxidoreductase
MAAPSILERDLERERTEPQLERDWLSRLNPRSLSAGALAARLGLGAILLAHGLQKLGFFGGAGWSGTLGFFEAKLGIPQPIGALVILTEALGGALLIVGLLARPVALAAAIEMCVAAAMVHVPNGFFLNWTNAPGVGHGIEMNLALLALAFVVMAEGGGRLALDTPLADTLDGVRPPARRA